MRSDMAKVLVERPRPDSRDRGKPMKGYRTRFEQQMRSDDGSPCHEGIRRPYGGSVRFNEHLGPLRRFLRSNVGRPWKNIHSEICAHINKNNVVQKHILTHLYEYVTVDPQWVDGIAYYPPHGWPRSSRIEGRDRYYVCQHGILRAAPPEPSKRQRRNEWRRKVDYREKYWVSSTEFLQQQDHGGWELVTVKRVPDDFHSQRNAKAVHDVNLKYSISTYDLHKLQKHYGKLVYATARRPVSTVELKLMPVPIELLRKQLKTPNVVR